MRKIYSLLILLTFIKVLSAQRIDDISFGADETLEVVTWNIERFPKNGETTMDYVVQVIETLNADVYALQEISDTTLFKQMAEGMEAYEWYFDRGWFGGLAYVYNKNTVEILDMYKIYDSQAYWKAFPRSPLVMEMRFGNENYIIINNHFKCCGDGILDVNSSNDEENRRLTASNLLKQYIDNNLENEKVIVVGDLNDILTDNSTNNVFQTFLDDTDNYQFTDLDIALGSNSDWSFPGWPSHLDHILITNELFDEFKNPGSSLQVIKVDDYLDGGLSEYDSNISDHRPVALKLLSNLHVGIDDPNQTVASMSSYPNPFKNKTTIAFTTVKADAEIVIFNLQGKKVDTLFVTKGKSSIIWNAEALSTGVYLAKLIVNHKTISSGKIILI